MSELMCFFVILYALSATLNKNTREMKKQVEALLKTLPLVFKFGWSDFLFLYDYVKGFLYATENLGHSGFNDFTEFCA